METDRPAGLTATLGHGAGTAEPLIAELTRAGCAREARLVAEGLERAARHLSAGPVRVTVGGCSGSGKSSLINMLIGAALLPTGELPETGVPCLLQSGEADRVLARTGDGVAAEIPFSTDAISGYVSLIGADGDYRAEISAVPDLRVSLAGRFIPASATWVDSPGISDVTLPDLAAELARAGDILIWVVSSRQALAPAEQDFLAAHIAEAGPASVAFVVNAFLEADTPQDWAAFTARRGRYESRITQYVETGGVPHQVTVTSARAAAAQPDGFGGPDVRALFSALSEPDAPRVRVTRLFRAVTELRRVSGELGARAAAEDERVTSAARQAAGWERTRAREHGEFTRAVQRETASVLSRYADMARECASEVAEAAGGSALKTAAQYGSEFDAKLRAVTGLLADQLAQTISDCAGQHGYRALPASGKSELSSALAPGPAAITGRGAGSAGPVAGGAAGAAIGAAIGAVFAGGGAVPGAWLGGVIGAGLGGNSAANRERAAIRAQLAVAGEAAAARLASAGDAVAAVAGRHCRPSAAAPPPPDRTRLDALRTARTHLEEDMLTALTDALRTAQAQLEG